jgi:hypothetical protein
VSSEKAGVGGSIPSLATIISSSYKPSFANPASNCVHYGHLRSRCTGIAFEICFNPIFSSWNLRARATLLTGTYGPIGAFFNTVDPPIAFSSIACEAWWFSFILALSSVNRTATGQIDTFAPGLRPIRKFAPPPVSGPTTRQNRLMCSETSAPPCYSSIRSNWR